MALNWMLSDKPTGNNKPIRQLHPAVWCLITAADLTPNIVS